MSVSVTAVLCSSQLCIMMCEASDLAEARPDHPSQTTLSIVIVPDLPKEALWEKDFTSAKRREHSCLERLKYTPPLLVGVDCVFFFGK